MIIQIYEIQTPSEAQALIEMGADHIGSVLLSEKTWKDASIRETLQTVAEAAKVRSSLIPLFSTPDAIFRVIDYYQPDIIHFCENLSDQNGISEICKSLIQLQEDVKKRFPHVCVMRCVPIAQPGMADRVPSLEIARMFEPVSDYFLTDTLLVKDSAESQPVSGFVGITGQICDWEIAAKLVEMSSIPVILAGGISPDNVREGIQRVAPAGVDSCTGTNALDSEARPIRFKKDFDKVKRLIEAARTASETV